MGIFLTNKHIVLGVTGSIAAYKSADLVRRLREVGAQVRVVMTANAKQFITPLTMQAVSGHPVHEDLFDLQAEAAMGHIELARWADLILVAPASADFMARLAEGAANDLLTTLCLATKAPMAIAPAMNQGMWRHPLTQANRERLAARAIHLLGPGEGEQACGDVGPGRMLEPEAIVTQVGELFKESSFAGLRVVMTAGPTHEAIDPVRFISNGSSGKMGYALAQAAFEAGAKVTLISGPVALAPPPVVCVSVVSALEMYAAVMQHMIDADIFIAVAAVADYRCQTIAQEKIHKIADTHTLTLVRNPDIVAAVAALPKRPFVVGFAAETERVIEQAMAKRERKKMDMIIANRVDQQHGIGSDDNEVTVISADSTITLPLQPKNVLAKALVKLIANAYRNKPINHGETI